MIRRPPRSTQSRSSAASDVYKRQPKKKPKAKPAEEEPAEEMPAEGGSDDDPPPLDISCLLYTSPSPRDRTRSRMPSSA